MAKGTDELYSGMHTLHRSQPFLNRAESSSAAGTTYPDGKMETGLTAQAGGSALFSFKVLTLQRWERDFQLKGTSYFPRFFVALQHLIGYTIIALMLLCHKSSVPAVDAGIT